MPLCVGADKTGDLFFGERDMHVLGIFVTYQYIGCLRFVSEWFVVSIHKDLCTFYFCCVNAVRNVS